MLWRKKIGYQKKSQNESQNLSFVAFKKTYIFSWRAECMENQACDFIVSTKKKMHILRVQIKFHLGQSEDCSLGGSNLDSSESLLQRDSGGKSVCKILEKMEDLMSPWRDSVLC